MVKTIKKGFYIDAENIQLRQMIIDYCLKNNFCMMAYFLKANSHMLDTRVIEQDSQTLKEHLEDILDDDLKYCTIIIMFDNNVNNHNKPSILRKYLNRKKIPFKYIIEQII